MRGVDFPAPIEEFWQTDFRKEKNRRFVSETEPGYSSSFTEQGFLLSLGKKNIFAWTAAPGYEYRDMVLEGLIDFSVNGGSEKSPAGTGEISDTTAGGKAGCCAFGFLLRYTTENNYYSVLVSDRGMVRMDAVFNGNPFTLLPWTAGKETDSVHDDSPEREDMLLPYRKNPSVFSLRGQGQRKESY